MRTILTLTLSVFLFIQASAQYNEARFEPADSTSFDQEMLTVRTRTISAIAFAATGCALITIGNQIQRGKIDTQLHPDNAFFPGYALVGVAAITAVNAWIHLKRAEFIADEYGIGIRIPLKFTP